MNARSLCSRRPGQSLPLIALIIVILFGMVGLAVDVGSTYAAQRHALRSANAASLAGMKVLTRDGTDRAAWVAIEESLRSNGIELAAIGESMDGKYIVNAQYFDANGDALGNGCRVGQCSLLGERPPANAAYIRVEVESRNPTYFARVVGRPDLPVDAQSFAGRCSPVSYVYPIGINGDSRHLDANGFTQPDDPTVPYGIYTDSFGDEYYMRRLYIKNDAGVDGDFSFLTWRPGTNLTDMLGGDGSLDLGFAEAAWPEGYDMAAFEGYPRTAGVLNADDEDWISIETSRFTYESARNALLTHKDQVTEMYLPIFVDDHWGDSGAAVQISRMGAFLLYDVGIDDIRGLYLDLVYLGEAGQVPCTLTSANVPGTEDNPNPKTYNLVGRVLIQPVHNIEDEGGRQPVSFIVVLDSSGSMTLNFAGQCGDPDSPEQCGATSNPNLTRVAHKPWDTVSERRITIAKQALYGFVDKMDENDQMRIIGYSTGYGNNAQPPRIKVLDAWEYGTTDGKLRLKRAVDGTGCKNYDPDDGEYCNADGERYYTEGGTPSASALWRANNLLNNDARAMDGVTAPNNKEYKRVVVFITDGVANQLLGTNGDYEWHNYDDGYKAADCTGDYKAENVLCQLGVRGDGKERPITAMVSQATLLKQGRDQDDPTDDVALYVMAMAGVPATGLPAVASQPSAPYYMPATEPSLVSEFLDSIFEDATEGDCQPGGGTNWISTIASDRLPDRDASSDTYWQQLDNDTFGFVFLYNDAGNVIAQAEIVEDTTTPNGGMVFRVNDIAPGTYRMRAFVGYKGIDDVSRSYSVIYNPYNYSRADEVTIRVTPSETLNRTIALDPTYLQLAGSVCPAPAMP